jgi:FlaA1/EpsC-like NDP-sugar epimerase
MGSRISSLSSGHAARLRTFAFGNVAASIAHMLHRVWQTQRSALILAADVALAVISYALAVFSLADSHGRGWPGEVFRTTLGLLIFFRLAGLISVRLYRRSLRHASILDLISIAKAVGFSSVLFWFLVWWQFPNLKTPAALFIVDWAFLQLLWGSLHFGPRVFKTQQVAWRKAGKRVLIVGAGDAGMTLLKELALDAASAWRPVAIVDDDPAKWRRSILGVPVTGGTKDVAKLAAETSAEEILICIPSATSSQMHGILSACRQTGIPVRTLPTLAELAGGRISGRNLRFPMMEDLLQREEVCVEVQETRRIVGGKVVLVTGAGGSIGSELCRQISEAGPRKLILVDKSENSLFYVHREVCEHLAASRVKPALLDLLCADQLHELLASERPEIIFHAAAHKHVGLLESHPQEAIRNNVLGTRNIAEAALECGTARFVNISTDKAVSPKNYMGLSKKLTELCIQEIARIHSKRFSNVRFGNVAGSTGSVLRLFWEQIQKGGPIRVTDPRATRYFMSVPEAVHLILRAAALGKGGETFVFDMGKALNIYEMAKAMMLFAGLKPERDLPIEFIGLSDGEKISEELWADWEQPLPTGTDRILVIGEQSPLARGILEKIRRMENFLAGGDCKGLLEYLHEVVPEFRGIREAAFHGAISPLKTPSMASMSAP